MLVVIVVAKPLKTKTTGFLGNFQTSWVDHKLVQYSVPTEKPLNKITEQNHGHSTQLLQEMRRQKYYTISVRILGRRSVVNYRDISENSDKRALKCEKLNIRTSPFCDAARTIFRILLCH